MDVLFSELTVWHWIALALGLLVVEMAVGTFDLLWTAIAAGITALFASVAPESVSSWEYEVGVFAIAAVALVLAGRTLFGGLRNPKSTHPNLNDRFANMVGQTALVTSEFVGGFGRVKINDSEWRAQFEGGTAPTVGDSVKIVSGEGSTVVVKTA